MTRPPSTPRPSLTTVRHDRDERRRRRSRQVVTIALVGLLVVGIGTVVVGEAVRQDPRRIAQSYMEALVAGDAGAANALTSAAADELPAPDSLEGADAIESFSLGEGWRGAFQPGDGERFEGEAFDVEYVVGGERFEDRIIVEDLGGWWVAQRWAIHEGLVAEVALWTRSPVSQVAAMFAGAERAVHAPILGEFDPPVLVYPGRYDVAPSSGTYLDVEPLEDAVIPDDTRIEIVASPTEAVRDLALATALEAAETCVQLASEPYLACDHSLFVGDVAPESVDVEWSVDDAPSVEPRDEPWAFDVATTFVATFVDESGERVERRVSRTAWVAILEVSSDAADAGITVWAPA